MSSVIQTEIELSLRMPIVYCSFNYTKVIHQPQYKSVLKVKKRKYVTEAYKYVFKLYTRL